MWGRSMGQGVLVGSVRVLRSSPQPLGSVCAPGGPLRLFGVRLWAVRGSVRLCAPPSTFWGFRPIWGLPASGRTNLRAARGRCDALRATVPTSGSALHFRRRVVQRLRRHGSGGGRPGGGGGGHGRSGGVGGPAAPCGFCTGSAGCPCCCRSPSSLWLSVRGGGGGRGGR